MKIIFVLPNMSAGGAERVVTRLSEWFICNRYMVDIVYLVDNYSFYELPKEVKKVYISSECENKRSRLKKFVCYLKAEKKNGKCVLVPFQESCLRYSLVAGKLSRIPVIACERNDPYRKGTGIIKKLKNIFPFVMAEYSVFQTYDAQQYYKVVKRRSCVIANPIEKTNIRWDGSCSPEQLITICRLHPQKNLPLLIDSIAIVKEVLPNIHLRIFGDGDIKDDLQKYANKKGVSQNVVFMGKTKSVYEELKKSSIFILSSDYEGISNSMLEALSVGVPIICTDCPIGGARMMLADGAGLLTPVGEAKPLADAIINLLSNYSMMEQMSHQALQKLRDYSIENIATQWANVFEHIVK